MLGRVNQERARHQHRIPYSRHLAPRQRDVPECLSYIIEGNRIRVPGKPDAIQFGFQIADVIETETAIVICLAVPAGKSCAENVYAIDRKGNLLWRVKPQKSMPQSGPYVGLSLSGNLVRLHCRDGGILDLNPEAGSVVAVAQRAE